jgi:hypothetical protein
MARQRRGMLAATATATRPAVVPVSWQLIHVRPSDLGLWAVLPDDVGFPISEHTNETDAERAAMRQAAALDDVAVIIDDRYARVRIVHPPAGRAAATRRRRPKRSGTCSPATNPSLRQAPVFV